MLMRGIVAVCLLSGIAYADPKGDIGAKTKAAMESYDMMDYPAATKVLNQALAISKKAKLDKDPVTARIHIDLGIAAFANGDADQAEVSFQNAVAIDPKIKIDAAYKSPELDKLLEKARAEMGGGAGPTEPAGDPGVDCASVKGFQHALIDSTKRGAPQPVEVLLGSDLKAKKVSAFYRGEGQTNFTEVPLTANGCKYTGNIPATAMTGSVVHYYVAAYGADNAKPIAAKGSAGSPNIMDVSGTATVATRPDTEDPLGGGGTKPTGGGETPETGISVGVEGPSKPAKVLIGVTAGYGAGYVTGTTESVMEEVKSCCIGSGGAVINAEIGYAISPKLSINLAARIGIPVGANAEGHATLAPAGLLRLRYGFSDTGEGVRIMGQLGVGILRNTIQLDDGKPGMDTDIVAQGPLLIGAGIGYVKNLTHAVAFVVDLSVLAGIAVTSSFSNAPEMNSGLTTDLSLGLRFGI